MRIGSRTWAGRQGPVSLGIETDCKAACLVTGQAVKKSKIRGEAGAERF
jgi:hypothetical protein